MISQLVRDLLPLLYQGQPGKTETDLLERITGGDLVAELRSAYPLTFQERRLRNKWEVGMARSLRTELAIHAIPNSKLFSLLVVRVFVDCVMLNIEGETVTGISRFNRLRVRAFRNPSPGLALTTSRGFKLDLTPDGWKLKPLQRRTVRLGEQFLKTRGWDFHHLAQSIPTP